MMAALTTTAKPTKAIRMTTMVYLIRIFFLFTAINLFDKIGRLVGYLQICLYLDYIFFDTALSATFVTSIPVSPAALTFVITF